MASILKFYSSAMVRASWGPEQGREFDSGSHKFFAFSLGGCFFWASERSGPKGPPMPAPSPHSSIPLGYTALLPRCTPHLGFAALVPRRSPTATR